jgi:uncharacterized membrane protein (DUF4010 family)
MVNQEALAFVVAAGVGLLVGLERERSKARHGDASPAGIRTFTLAALLGGVAGCFESTFIATATVVAVGALAVAAYFRSPSDDLGLTTEVALLLMPLLGLLAHPSPVLAAGLGVVVTVLLAARSRLHEFVRNVLTPQEVHDALLLAAASLVVLPLMPQTALDPWGAVNLRLIWTLAVLVMVINGAGYIALRAFGARLGLPLSGLVGGFVSSTATHAAMGARLRETPSLTLTAIAGASLSSLATPVFMLIVLGVAHWPLCQALLLPMSAAILASGTYGLFFIRRLAVDADHSLVLGRAFELRTAIVFAVSIGVVLAASTGLMRTIGSHAAVAGIALAGFADAQAAGASAAALAARAEMPLPIAAFATLVAFSGNALVKVVVAWIAGGRRFALLIAPGQALVLASIWLTWWFGGPF